MQSSEITRQHDVELRQLHGMLERPKGLDGQFPNVDEDAVHFETLEGSYDEWKAQFELHEGCVSTHDTLRP